MTLEEIKELSELRLRSAQRLQAENVRLRTALRECLKHVPPYIEERYRDLVMKE
jgi:hypothetical protein